MLRDLNPLHALHDRFTGRTRADKTDKSMHVRENKAQMDSHKAAYRCGKINLSATQACIGTKKLVMQAGRAGLSIQCFSQFVARCCNKDSRPSVKPDSCQHVRSRLLTGRRCLEQCSGGAFSPGFQSSMMCSRSMTFTFHGGMNL